jgi:predicted dehydrogenase
MDIAIIGCGNIAEKAYLPYLAGRQDVRVVALGDLDPVRAEAMAAKFLLPFGGTVDAAINRPGVGLVVNLTVPKAHGSVDLLAIQAGRHVYSEKPLTLDRHEAGIVLNAASLAGVRVGCAPDTVLGGGHQTCRMLIDHGAIGTVVAGTAVMMCPGHESWHPSPEFYYEAGGGPLFDMGPYYLHALIAMLGPVRRVSGSARVTHAERIITSQPKAGTRIPVEVPTHVAAVLDFASGAVVTLVTSFDVITHRCPIIELYGTAGTISVPDPNGFGGEVRICRQRRGDWETVGLSHANTGNCRGLGVVDMAAAISRGRDHRANERIAFHAIDVMQAIHESSRDGHHVMVSSTCERPIPMPLGAGEGVVDG